MTNLVVPITTTFSVRYLLRTGMLHQLTEVAELTVLLGWNDDALASELSTLAKVERLPEVRLGSDYERLLRLSDLAFRQRLRSPSTAIDRRRAEARLASGRRLKRVARHVAETTLVRIPGAEGRLRSQERATRIKDTNLAECSGLLARLGADALFSVTPFVRQEILLLAAAEEAGMPRLTSILSFDNLTTRPPLPVAFDRYLVWNRHNQAELERAYGVGAERVEVVGAPQLDFHLRSEHLWPEADWRARLGVPADRPVILYASGPPEIAPGEEQIVEHIDAAVEEGRLPGRPVVLVRRHPVDDPQRWADTERRARHVVFDDPWPQGVPPWQRHRSDMSADTISGLVSSLAHSAAHVSVSSTIPLDGAFHDRPQVCPAFGPDRATTRIIRDLYEREHYLPLTRSRGLELPASSDELVDALHRSLERPHERSEARRRMLADVCTFVDGRCTDRVVDAVRRWLSGVAPS